MESDENDVVLSLETNIDKGNVSAPDIDQSKVEVAVRFLRNVNVKNTDKDRKVTFLKSKGLSDAEVDVAFSRSAAADAMMSTNDESSSWSLFDYVKGIVLGASILSAANYAYKAYFLPYVAHEMKDDRRIEVLSESVQVMKDDLKQNTYELTGTLKQMQGLLEDQQKLLADINNELRKGSSDTIALTDLKSELATVKSMMLSRRQFPAAPFATTSLNTTEIPAWQRVPEKSSEEGNYVEVQAESLMKGKTNEDK